jgi:threonine dehydrogenase-like Zn-dependent dehydrogenase
MLAAVLHDFNQLKVEEIPAPRAEKFGEVVVQIKSCGICATDYKAIKGIRRNVHFPLIPGHEPSGIVVEAAPGVTQFKEGDEVAVMPSGSCGFCEYCRTGRSHYCQNAFTTGGDGPKDVWPGAFAQFMKTMDRCLFPKPSDISFDAAALTEPLSGAWKGIVQYSEMEVGDDVVIIGVGSIGLLCLMVAKAAGAGRLIAVDRSDYALRNAVRLGATHAVNPESGDTRTKIYEIIPEGPDLIIEAAGPIQAVQLMVDLRRRGTRWNVFGITTHEKFELDGGHTHVLEGRMDASFGTNPLAMSKAIRLMQKGLVATDKIISHHFPLSQIHEAMDVMSTKEHNKIMIHP